MGFALVYVLGWLVLPDASPPSLNIAAPARPNVSSPANHPTLTPFPHLAARPRPSPQQYTGLSEAEDDVGSLAHAIAATRFRVLCELNLRTGTPRWSPCSKYHQTSGRWREASPNHRAGARVDLISNSTSPPGGAGKLCRPHICFAA